MLRIAQQDPGRLRLSQLSTASSALTQLLLSDSLHCSSASCQFAVISSRAIITAVIADVNHVGK